MLQISVDGFQNALAPRTEVLSDNLVRRVLSKYKLSQGQLAELLGVSLNTVNCWACERKTMHRNMRMQLEGMLQGYMLPDHIRDKYVARRRLGMQWRRVRKGLSLSLTDTILNRDGS